jgi:hypothetical protein
MFVEDFSPPAIQHIHFTSPSPHFESSSHSAANESWSGQFIEVGWLTHSNDNQTCDFQTDAKPKSCLSLNSSQASLSSALEQMFGKCGSNERFN